MLNRYKKLGGSLGLIAALGVAILMASCNSGGSSASPSATAMTTSKISTPPLKDDFFLVQMGSGYDTSTDTATSNQSCLAAAGIESSVYIENPSAMLTFGTTQSFAQLETSLGVDVSGDMGGGVFSGSLAAQYAENSQDTEYALNIIYLYQYAGTANFKQGILGQGKSALTPVAASYAFGGNPVDFRRMCGNNFVAQMDAGVVLGVTLNLSFDSAYEKNQFMANLNGNVGLINAMTAIKTAEQATNANVSFSINAIQLGGEPQQLNNVFGKESSDGNYPFLDCGNINNGPSLQACNATIDNVVNYATTLESQIQNKDGSINMYNLYYTQPVLAKYNTLGIYANAPDPSPAILKAMRDLSKTYSQVTSENTFVNHYASTLYSQLSVGTVAALSDSSNKLNNQLNNVLLNSAYQAVDCYKGNVSIHCVQIYNNIESGIAAYQLSNTEQTELNYLETSSYLGSLYVNSSLLAQCVLAPISDPDTNFYAINCNDSWLPITSSAGLTIQAGMFPNSLAVNGLTYLSNGQTISYMNGQGIGLTSGFYPTDYTSQPTLLITDGTTPITSSGILELTMESSSQS